MDNLLRILIFLLFPGVSFAAWTSEWVDGPAPANYQRSNTALRTIVDLPKYGGHVVWTLPSSAPATGMGNYVGPVSSATTPQIGTKVQIPFGKAAGALAAATLTVPVAKSALATAATAMVRANPAVSAAITLGWLANAGINFVTDHFEKSATTVSTSPQCTALSFGDAAQTTTTFYSRQCANSSQYKYSGWGILRVCTPTNQTCISQSTSDVILSVPLASMPGGVAPKITLNDADTATKLGNTPMSGTSDTAANFDGALGETYKNGYAPSTNGATGTLTGPTQIQGEHYTTTLPNGDVSVHDEKINNTYTNNYVDSTTVVTDTVTHPNNTTETTTQTGATTLSQQYANQPVEVTGSSSTSGTSTSGQSDCDKYPNSIGCSEYGNISAADAVTKIDVPIDLTPTSLGAGSCPAPTTLTFSRFGSVSWSYQPYCDFATAISPLIIAFAWLSAGLIVLGAVKE